MGLEVQVLSWAQKSKDGKSAGEAGAFSFTAMHGIKNQQLRLVLKTFQSSNAICTWRLWCNG
jgi:hypothetical protein